MMENEIARKGIELSSTEVAVGRSQLEAALGSDADVGPWLPRLARTKSGEYRIIVKRPAPAFEAPSAAAPLPKMMERERYFTVVEEALPIDEAVALLTDPGRNPELVVETRQRELADEQERLRGAEAQRRDQAARERQDQQRREAETKEFRAEQFAALDGWAKLAYRLALLHEKHGQADLARDIRGLAAECRPASGASLASAEAARRSGPSPVMQKWWE